MLLVFGKMAVNSEENKKNEKNDKNELKVKAEDSTLCSSKLVKFIAESYKSASEETIKALGSEEDTDRSYLKQFRTFQLKDKAKAKDRKKSKELLKDRGLRREFSFRVINPADGDNNNFLGDRYTPSPGMVGRVLFKPCKNKSSRAIKT